MSVYIEQCCVVPKKFQKYNSESNVSQPLVTFSLLVFSGDVKFKFIWTTTLRRFLPTKYVDMVLGELTRQVIEIWAEKVIEIFDHFGQKMIDSSFPF